MVDNTLSLNELRDAFKVGGGWSDSAIGEMPEIVESSLINIAERTLELLKPKGQHQAAPSQEVVERVAWAIKPNLLNPARALETAHQAIAAMSQPDIDFDPLDDSKLWGSQAAIQEEQRREISVVEAIREAIRSPRFGRFSTGEPQQVDLILKAIGPYLKACELCNCTGDVHRADGEWMGACPYCAPKPVMVDDKALYHLGGVLTMLAELHPDDQCRAYVEALEYHNANSTDGVIVPSEGYSSRIVTTGPLDLIMQASDQPVQETIEALAALEHDQWLHWMRTVILEEAISIKRKERWWSCDKPYHELTEEQKEHDRVWARKVLEIVRPSVRESSAHEIIDRSIKTYRAKHENENPPEDTAYALRFAIEALEGVKLELDN